MCVRQSDGRACAQRTQGSRKPKQHETEMRCYIRDPDGYLIEVGQTILARGRRPRLDRITCVGPLMKGAPPESVTPRGGPFVSDSEL